MTQNLSTPSRDQDMAFLRDTLTAEQRDAYHREIERVERDRDATADRFIRQITALLFSRGAFDCDDELLYLYCDIVGDPNGIGACPDAVVDHIVELEDQIPVDATNALRVAEDFLRSLRQGRAA